MNSPARLLVHCLVFLASQVYSTSATSAVLGVYDFDLDGKTWPARFGFDLELASGPVLQGSGEVTVFGGTLYEFQSRTDTNVSAIVTSATDPQFDAFVSRLTNGTNEWLDLLVRFERTTGGYIGTSAGSFWESDIAPGIDFQGYSIDAIEIVWYGPLGGLVVDGSVVFHGSAVPLPGAFWMFGIGLIGLFGASLRTK